MFIVEVQQPDGTWQRWGGGNTLRTAQTSEANAKRAYPGAETRIRRER
jgi:hypothetical protein